MGRLVVDMTRCQGRGICALVAPDEVELDRYGFAMLADRHDEIDERQARRAVRSCPTGALTFVADDATNADRLHGRT